MVIFVCLENETAVFESSVAVYGCFVRDEGQRGSFLLSRVWSADSKLFKLDG